MTNAIILQAKDGFTLSSDIINAMKQLFGEKINVIELDGDMVEALQSEISQADTIKLKRTVEKLDKGELKFYTENEFSQQLAKRGYRE
ncbi:hypothetical protein [Campylobacter sp. CCUG 57310]|uniref:hypothetical protein n=1 Tax=Campylobacter sp. CCUG 57310 TaxID=2517362 RepID=UPI001563E5ED|nr:hypothetical protein [Campylobacter sp. CCUG 57310]QKF93243.1 hypothetical protein CORI_b008 [Campylobacter sp. CCUG 57310]